MGAETENQGSAAKEEDGRGGEGDLHVEGAPEKAHKKTGDKVAGGVDSSKCAESHAVLLVRNEIGGEGVFQRLFGADVETCQSENQSQQPQRMRSQAKKNCGDTRERVACREDEFALRNVIAEPATKVRRAGVEDVVKCVETDGQAGSARETVTRRQHPGSIKNQQ